jgi:heat shock protein HslJ
MDYQEPVEETPVDEEENVEEAPAQAPAGSNRLLWILGGLVAMALVACLCVVVIGAGTYVAVDQGQPAGSRATATRAAAMPVTTPTAGQQPGPTPTMSQLPQPVMIHPSQARVGEQVTFDGSQSQPGSSPIVSYKWDLGDGSAARGDVVTHIYDSPGTYQVSLSISGQDGFGNFKSSSIEIIDKSAPEPTRDMTAELIGLTWEWVRLVDPVQGNRSVPNPADYTLVFNEDGSFYVQADCNNGSGSYVASGERLMMAVGPMTRAMCPPESLFDQYLSLVNSVRRFQIDGSQLLLHLQGEGRYMVFER